MKGETDMIESSNRPDGTVYLVFCDGCGAITFAGESMFRSVAEIKALRAGFEPDGEGGHLCPECWRRSLLKVRIAE